MATGGTIPTSKTQSLSFYNTTGVIEKDKNIYYAPRFSKGQVVIGTEVRTAYLNRFNGICPPSSAYTDISVSGWSPQDKTLVVKGNIDDFRLVTEEGACLNYFIVTRQVTKNNVTKAYYYGFFITGVEQYGGASVRLSIAPDDFSNVFYLHNTHQLTYAEIQGDYEPFNERMKNCYVQRQHYDRVVNYSYDYLDIGIVLENPRTLERGTFQVGEYITFDFEDGNDTRVSGEILEVDDSLSETTGVIQFRVKSPEKVIGEPQHYSTIQYGEEVYVFDYATEELSWHTVEDIQPTNQQIFLNQEESFKFKYQYRDKKYPYRLTAIDLETINEEDTFSNLTLKLRKKIILSCISYLVVELKSIELLTNYEYRNVVDSSHIYHQNVIVKKGNLISDNFNRPNAVVSYPFFDIPDIFEKYSSAILAYDFTCKMFNNSDEFETTLTNASELFDSINQKALADWIYSAYIVRDVNIPDSRISLTSGHVQFVVTCPDVEKPLVDYNVVSTKEYKKGLYLAGITNDPESIGQITVLHEILVQWGVTGDVSRRILSASGCSLGLVVSGYDKKEIKFNVFESIPDLKNNYFDPVLEAEPYSFYSISFLNFELPFNKNRYYLSGSSIKLNYFLSINGAVKCSMIPLYNVENKEFLYYNEGLSFTIDSALPLTSDSYSSYYYVNKAQMKNQFAVNDYNRGVDLLQHAFISGPNAVGVSASKRGYVGALTETGNQVMQMADELVDWAQSNKVIDMNQKAKLADMGAKPDTIKQTGTDSLYDLATNEGNIYVNHYTIDSMSYQSISKFLERIGYQVNLYATLNVMNRVGWNFVKLNSFDLNPAYDMMTEQEDSIKKIFSEGVTLLHDKSYLTSGHNYETILDE